MTDATGFEAGPLASDVTSCYSSTIDDVTSAHAHRKPLPPEGDTGPGKVPSQEETESSVFEETENSTTASGAPSGNKSRHASTTENAETQTTVTGEDHEIQIHITTPRHHLSVEVLTLTSLSDLLLALEDYIPSGAVCFYFAGERLENQRTLSDYDIKPDSVLHAKQVVKLSIIFRGELTEMVVPTSHTVGHLKTVLKEKTGICVMRQRLTFNGTSLDDPNRLTTYELVEEAELQLLELIQLIVVTPTGELIKVLAHPSDKVSDMKHDLYKTLLITDLTNYLFVEYKHLDDERTLGDYYITEESVLHLMTVITVSWVAETERPYWARIYTTYAIETVVAMVQSQHQILPKKNRSKRIIFAVKELEKGMGLPFQFQSRLPTVHLVCSMKIKMTDLGNKMMILSVHPMTTVRTVKNIIQELTGTPPFRQELMFSGQVMDDHCQMNEYNVLQFAQLLLHIHG